jgi:ribosomal protein L11 methylase PrmA
MGDAAAVLSSSYRDPSGSVFTSGNVLHRTVMSSYREHYDHLMGSGLYNKLVEKGLLVSHHEHTGTEFSSFGAYKIITPRRISFVSFPYEWSFSQLKDAALLTLAIQDIALEHGMTLKDATAFNVQFEGGRPCFIDTLSFEKYREGTPWVAYRQFCEHFLAPLALMSRGDVRIGKLFVSSLDGVPLDLAARLLPKSTLFSFGLLTHIHLHARSQRKFSDASYASRANRGAVSKNALRGLIDHLRSTISALTWAPGGTEWSDYYNDTNYSDGARTEKEQLVADFLAQCPQGMTWDFGANTGVFSELAVKRGNYTVAWDIDPSAVEKAYLRQKHTGATGLLPLQLDLMNPSPALGWAHDERASLVERGPAQVLIALALIHHLAISHNVPLEKIAAFFSACAEHIIIEFVPKEDSQVQRLLASRPDIFPNYTLEGFKAALTPYCTIAAEQPITGSSRTLFLLRSNAKR